MTTACKQLSLTKAYFYEECCRFRKIMQDRRNSIENIDKAFQSLAYVFLNVKPDECDENCRITWSALGEEWARRSAYMMMAGHPVAATEFVFCDGDV